MASTGLTQDWKRWHIFLFLGFITVLSFLTYFHRYWEPPAVFWDENYHIASAQKYLHGVFFMEQHPPLGKMLIALGEKMIQPNARTDQFLNTDYGTDFNDISFVGYRFFSALLSWWTAPLVFLIFLLILRNPLWSSLLSFLYVFDNALIVHTRGAMLEGPLMFFSALLILFFLLLLRDRENRRRMMLWSALFGVAFALCVTTKVLGLSLILFVLPVGWVLRRAPQKILLSGALMLAGFLPVYAAVWQTHFALGQTVREELPDQGYYQASGDTKIALATGTAGSADMFWTQLGDSLAYVTHYNSGAPRLDLCKEDENGSPVYFWPFGARTINYRWETPDGSAYRYLYLVPNPAAWWIALFGVFLGTAILLCSSLFRFQNPPRHRFLLCVFLGMYFAYMIAVSRIDRVLYLYHYFTPLLISFIITALVFAELQAFGKRALGEQGKTIIALGIAGIVFLSHQFYRPLTYYEPLTDKQFSRRNIFNLWDMRCVNCGNHSGLVIPSKTPGQ